MYRINNLAKKYASSGMYKIGEWNGYSVVAATMKDKVSFTEDTIYCLVDDKGKLIYRSGVYLIYCGYLRANGQVIEDDTKIYHTYDKIDTLKDLMTQVSNNAQTTAAAMNVMVDSLKNYNEELKKEKEKVEKEKAEAAVIGDVVLGIMVEETLATARNVSIDSLLDGFNYGLDVN